MSNILMALFKQGRRRMTRPQIAYFNIEISDSRLNNVSLALRLPLAESVAFSKVLRTDDVMFTKTFRCQGWP